MRDDFSTGTKRLLAYRAGHRCSICATPTAGPHSDPSKFINLDWASHIFSASEGCLRSNPNLTSEERQSPENGIWLCPKCAKIIDTDEVNFPEKVLLEFKYIAERRAFTELNQIPAIVADTLP